VPEDLVSIAELNEVAMSAEALADCAPSLLSVLRRHVPFEGAWLALADPPSHSYRCLASADLDEGTLQYLCGPEMAHDVEVTGTDQRRPPSSPSDLPYPVADLPTWAECLLPAGYHEALAVALFTPDGRHVGFLALLSGATEPPAPAARWRLGRLAPLLGHAIDPMRSLVPAARLVPGATAGVVLREDGGTEALPGLDDHALLAADSAAVLAARSALAAGTIHTSFLWPATDDHAAPEHVRITAMAATQDAPSTVSGMALVSPPGDVHGLTPRELEVLGLVINGCSNREIARALVVAQRTVAAHLEHILVKMEAPSRTLAAVRAERQGLYVPPGPRRLAG
jgi:DNA-binding CsgD family transcriptional regulator